MKAHISPAQLLRAGFWLSPEGDYFQVLTHIASVCDAPQFFGLDAVELRAAFDAVGEGYGTEGKARNEVIRTLVFRGWIRLRNYGNNGWTVNVGDVSRRNRGLVTAVFRELYDGRVDYSPVHIDHPEGVETLDVNDVVRCALLQGESCGLPALRLLNAPPKSEECEGPRQTSAVPTRLACEEVN